MPSCARASTSTAHTLTSDNVLPCGRPKSCGTCVTQTGNAKVVRHSVTQTDFSENAETRDSVPRRDKKPFDRHDPPLLFALSFAKAVFPLATRTGAVLEHLNRANVAPVVELVLAILTNRVETNDLKQRGAGEPAG